MDGHANRARDSIFFGLIGEQLQQGLDYSPDATRPLLGDDGEAATQRSTRGRARNSPDSQSHRSFLLVQCKSLENDDFVNMAPTLLSPDQDAREHQRVARRVLVRWSLLRRSQGKHLDCPSCRQHQVLCTHPRDAAVHQRLRLG
jgi:hypothetical protein